MTDYRKMEYLGGTLFVLVNFSNRYDSVKIATDHICHVCFFIIGAQNTSPSMVVRDNLLAIPGGRIILLLLLL